MAPFFILVVLPLTLVVFLLRHHKRGFYAALLFGLLVISGIAIYAFPHCVPSAEISHIHPGLSPEDAVALLGSPVSTTGFSDGRSKLGYSKPFRYCTVDVFVDSTHHVTGVFHDH